MHRTEFYHFLDRRISVRFLLLLLIFAIVSSHRQCIWTFNGFQQQRSLTWTWLRHAVVFIWFGIVAKFSIYTLWMLQQSQSQQQQRQQQLPFIYLFMYPFLSHELVFIIGRIYVVKLCGKLTKSLILLVLCGRSVSSFGFCSFFLLCCLARFRFILFSFLFVCNLPNTYPN